MHFALPPVNFCKGLSLMNKTVSIFNSHIFMSSLLGLRTTVNHHQKGIKSCHFEENNVFRDGILLYMCFNSTVLCFKTCIKIYT